MDFMLFIAILMSLVVYADGCRFGSGSNCAFPCNCNNDGCDQETGDCTDYGGCKSVLPIGFGWDGPGCRVGNIAYGKQSGQSSDQSSEHGASLGNDGNNNCDNYDHHTHTNEDNPAWYNVTLGKKYHIVNVTLFDRGNADKDWGRLQGAKIQIIDGTNLPQDCATITNDLYDVYERVQTFPCDMIGDTVRIYKDSQAAFFHICEFVVMGYPYISRLRRCTEWLSDELGCGKCQSGMKLPDCADNCSSGYYGVNCQYQCSTHCRPTSGTPTCSIDNGKCNECYDWRIGDMCNTEIIALPIHNTDITVATTSSSISIFWNAAVPPPSGSQRYYHYIIKYKPVNGMYMETETIPLKDETNSKQSYTIHGLQHNTQYKYIVRSVRTVGDMRDDDSGSSELSATTMCIDPVIPNDLSVTVLNTGNQVTVTWTGDLTGVFSGCDSMDTQIEYKFSNQDEWQSEDMSGTGLNEYTFQASGKTECWVRITFINNENKMSSTNEGYTKITTVPGQTSPKPVSSKPGEPDTTRANLDTPDPDELKSTKKPTNVGMIAGVAVAGIVCVVLVVIVVLLFTRYRRSLPVFGKKKDKESKQKLSIDVKFETGKSVTPMGDVPIMPGPAPPSSPKPKPISPRPQPAAKPVVQVNTSIPVSQLGSYIAKKRKERDGFKNEYATLPEDETAPCERGSLPENKTKNRFLNIRAYDHSRVILETENADPFSDYINCNYIPGFDGNKEHYIAGQGPKPHNIVDLWRMIWQKKINRIAMMTNEIENSRRKCDRYWPENVEGSQQYGAITVTTMGIERFPFYTIRLLRVQKDGVSRSVRQFHFTAWIDKRIPEYAFPLLGFRKKVRMYDKQSTGPLFVHCSAGVGRTGTFIAIDYLLEQAKHKHTIDVRKWVNTMRGCRINMIQTLEQYIFVYDTLQEALACGDTSIPASELETTLKQLKVKQKGEKISPLEAQYKVIDDFRPVPKGEDFKALSEDNIHKNRDPNIYPSDLARPYLLTKSENGNDYINAVFVHGYNRSNHYLITQMPLPTTAVDFWRMVCDIDIVTIVALNEINDEDCTPYWPDENDSTETYGPIEVAFKSSQDDEIASVSTFEITNNENGGRKKEVEHIRMMNWPDNTLPDPKNLIHIVNLLEQRAQLHNEGNVVIHCLKGVSNSGILVAALNMIEKLKIDQEIDVFTAVKAIRINRNMFIESFEQYEYLYQVAQTYKAMNDTYANFS